MVAHMCYLPHPEPTRYSDPRVTLTYRTSGFVKGETLATSGVTGRPVLSTPALSDPITQAPGAYPVVNAQGSLAAGNCTFNCIDGTYTVNPEDAVSDYTGRPYISTASTVTTAAVNLSATISDTTAINAKADNRGGDIRNATVAFEVTDSQTGAAVGTYPAEVTLVKANNQLVAKATAAVTLDVGGYLVAVRVGGHYAAPSIAPAPLEVAAPRPGSVSGAGHVTLAKSSGRYLGANGTSATFGLNVGYNESPTSFLGHVFVVYRGDGRVYKIVSTAIEALTMDAPKRGVLTALVEGTASILDITDPQTPSTLAEDCLMQLVITDNGDRGTEDSVAITLWGGAGRDELLFSSSWSDKNTLELKLKSGNMQIIR